MKNLFKRKQERNWKMKIKMKKDGKVDKTYEKEEFQQSFGM